MFHLEDRQGRELGLGPTHEEVITAWRAICCAPTVSYQ
jgi:prolyl-tRNA synthetase